MNDEIEYNYDNLVVDYNYSEFSHLQRVENPITPFARGYVYKNGLFYIEPWFYTTLTRLLDRFPRDKTMIIATLFSLADTGEKILFTKDALNPLIKDDTFQYVEIEDLISKANLVFDDISRGSDYGD